MKGIRFLTMLAAALLTAVTVAAPAMSVRVEAANQYEVKFSAGKGYFTDSANGSNTSIKSETFQLSYGDPIDDSKPTADIKAPAGYIFSSWDIAANATAEKQTTYVAKYKKALDVVIYKVNYVDTYGNPVSTGKTMQGNKGDSVSENARAVTGYAVDTSVKSLTLTGNSATDVISFVYTNTQSTVSTVTNTVTTESVVTLPGETVYQTVTVPGTTTTAGGTTAGGTTAGGTTAGGTTAGGTTVVPNEEVPLANGTASSGSTTNSAASTQSTVTIPDESTPLTNGGSTATNSNVTISDESTPLSNGGNSGAPTALLIGIGCGGAAILVALAVAFALKKKRNG